MSALLAALAGSSSPVTIYADDVFSAYTYTGNGGTQSVVNGIDLAGKGGMVWAKDRDDLSNHGLYDTGRGVSKSLSSNATSSEFFSAGTEVTAFNSNGFSLAGSFNVNINISGKKYSSWTFRKAPKFFDIVTWTGTGANRTIAHNLGVVPGMIFVKRTDTTGNWQVYHNSLANTEFLLLNTTAAKATDATKWNSTTATSLVFSLGTHVDVNALGGTYIAYVFGHDTGASGIIQCGSFTSDGAGNITAPVTLGWEPQFLIWKESRAGANWKMSDTARGLTVATSGGTSVCVFPNTTDAESSATQLGVTATGFTASPTNLQPSQTFYYMAIRRPNKPPTSGTQVYKAVARTGTGAAAVVTGVGFAPDVSWAKSRSSGSHSHIIQDSLRGPGAHLDSASTAAEPIGPASDVTSFDIDGVSMDVDSLINASGETYINWYLKRASGVFDEVCWTTTASTNRRVTHNLSVVPELIIHKSRSAVGSWPVYSATLGRSNYLILNTTGSSTALANTWGTSNPTASDFGVDETGWWASSVTVVSYLFATLAGISKVGSYTGNGTSQTINCGFAAGARFILIKRTDSTGDWYVWDTVRGIVAGNDPHLSFNTTAADVTTDDSIDPDSTGFIVNQLAATNINVNTATYIYLAFA